MRELQNAIQRGVILSRGTMTRHLHFRKAYSLDPQSARVALKSPRFLLPKGTEPKPGVSSSRPAKILRTLSSQAKPKENYALSKLEFTPDSTLVGYRGKCARRPVESGDREDN